MPAFGGLPLYKKIRGTIETLFQLGLNGPNLKNNSDVIECRNSDDTGFAQLRVAAPSNDNDVVTKYYADSIAKPTLISRQADCSVAIPNNTAVRGFVVVTTAGNGAVIGDLLYDDGSSTGQMQIVAAVEGRTIAVTDALSGGTATFDADSIYIWDADNTTWTKIGDIGSVTGGIRVVRYSIDNSAQQDSVNQIPANARILESRLDILDPYSAGAEIYIQNTNGVEIMSIGENDPQNSNSYVIEQDTDWGPSASVVRTFITNSPAAGSGVVIVKFCLPLA